MSRTERPADHPTLGKDPDWRMLWGTTAVSALGTSVASFSLPLTIYAMTQSLRAATVVLTLGAGCSLLASVFGGAYVDRTDKRRLMLACNAVRLLASVILCLLVAIGAGSIIGFCAAYCIVAVSTALYGPASATLVREIVPAESRTTAASLNQARQGAASILGPPVGGVLMGLGRALPFAFDAATYVVALLGVLRVRTRVPRSVAPRKRYLVEVRDGLLFCLTNSVLSKIISFAFLANFVFSASFLVANLDLVHHCVTASAISVVDMLAGVATIVGSLSVRHLRARFESPTLVPVAALVSLVALVGMCFAGHSVVWVAVALSLAMLPFPVLTALIFGTILNEVPADLQGRVNSAGSFASTALVPLAPAFCGWGLTSLGATDSRIILVVLTALAFLPLIAIRHLLDPRQPPVAASASSP